MKILRMTWRPNYLKGNTDAESDSEILSTPELSSARTSTVTSPAVLSISDFDSIPCNQSASDSTIQKRVEEAEKSLDLTS